MSEGEIVIVKVEELTCPKISACEKTAMDVHCYNCGAAIRRLIHLGRKVG